jgi:electron transfer flavoprotein alpha subunit
MGTILVVAEIAKGAIREASYELVAIARSLAEAGGHQVNGLVVGSGVGDLAKTFASKGAGKTYVVDSPAAANYNPEVHGKAIKAAAKASGASLVLISNTPTGWDVAPRVAAGLIAPSYRIAWRRKRCGFQLVRRVFNGKLTRDRGDSQTVATIQPGWPRTRARATRRKLSIISVEQVVEIKIAESTGVDLTKADVTCRAVRWRPRSSPR